MKTDHELFEGLTRALGHTVADYARRHESITGRAVLSAALQLVLEVGVQSGAELPVLINALRKGWPTEALSREAVCPGDGPGADQRPLR